MHLGLPLPLPRLRDGIRTRRVLGHIAHPGVPAGLDLAGVVVLVGVVDPAGAEGELVLQVFVVLVSELVGGD